MLFLISNTIIKKDISHYILSFPLDENDNKNKIIIAFEKFKFKEPSIIYIDGSFTLDNSYAKLETIHFKTDHINVFIKILNTPMGQEIEHLLDTNNIRFKCILNEDDKIIVNIIPYME